jgi:hypothetical protein
MGGPRCTKLAAADMVMWLQLSACGSEFLAAPLCLCLLPLFTYRLLPWAQKMHGWC